jgi:hypothetical protein
LKFKPEQFMKIESILKRQGGTHADIGGISYHFEPLDDGAHVADVEQDGHIDAFLAIPEGYKVYHGKIAPKGKASTVVALKLVPITMPSKTTVPLAGSEQHPPVFDVNGRSFTQLEVVAKAFAASGLTSDEWNDLGDDERAAKIDITLDDMADADEIPTAADADEAVAADARALLVSQYEEKFGKKPHYRLSAEKIQAELEG